MGAAALIYRSLVPESFRWKIIHYKRNKELERIKRSVLLYYDNNPSNDLEINEALDFLRKNALSVFPYPFFLSYVDKKIDVKIDPANKLPYVMHSGKKLYFKMSWTTEHIIDAYRFLLAEQDERSAHCYLNKDYSLEENDVVVDVGAAEGIFALHHIEKIKHLYLIETDNEWIEAIKETYKPWQSKITIINKFVSDKDDDKNVRLDTYFSNIEKIEFLKIDVDGAERNLLNGAEITVASKVKKLAICTYHKPNDNSDFSAFLTSKNYAITNSKGYMLFHFDPDFGAPFFRRGLIKAEKKP